MAKVPVDETNEEPDVCIIELGGTVGDIESMPFVEALTQLRRRAGKDNFVQIHVSYVPVVHGEQKTKPTQMAIKSVRSAGLIPDLVPIGILNMMFADWCRLHVDVNLTLTNPRLRRLLDSVRSTIIRFL